jgi:hypothetical protein
MQRVVFPRARIVGLTMMLEQTIDVDRGVDLLLLIDHVFLYAHAVSAVEITRCQRRARSILRLHDVGDHPVGMVPRVMLLRVLLN